jgi:hypothetical protein
MLGDASSTSNREAKSEMNCPDVSKESESMLKLDSLASKVSR